MWDDLIRPWRACLDLAWESFLEGSRSIGAVIVDADGTVVSSGRNRSATAVPDSGCQIHGGPLSHAEINALLALDPSRTDVQSLQLYTTVEPCPLCIGAICMMGVKHVHYAARDSWAGSTNLLRASPYLRWKQIVAYPPANRDLETIVHMLQVADELGRNHPRTELVLKAWEEHYPENVRRGRRLFDSGELARLKDDRASAEDAMKRLWDLSKL